MKLSSRLLLFDFLSSELGASGDELRLAAKKVERGRRSDGHSNYLSLFDSWGALVKIDRSDLAEYDMNILRIEDRLAKGRPGFQFTYFQYLALLYTERFLHRLASDPGKLLNDLRKLRNSSYSQGLSSITQDDLRKAAYWMATGSGKTLVAHANLLQFVHYQPFTPDNILLLTPSPALSTQHLDELAQSGIKARHALDEGSQADVQVLEITKLFVDQRDSERPRGGESLPTSTFEGQNLILVDEGHKGSTTPSDRDEERRWREVRRSMAGDKGFVFEYSATFAQITENNDELLDEYGKAILFDYGYKHFWEDGYGKDYRVVNLKQEGAYDTDELLFAGLLVLYEQARYFAEHRAAVSPYNIAAPLMTFIGSTVTGAVESEVQRVVEFLDRVLTEPQWARDQISSLLTDSAGLPSDLFSHHFPYLDRLSLSPEAIYEDLCRRLFRGSGRLVMHSIQRADGEIGLRTADSSKDVYCGVINVGNASAFANRAEEAGISRGEDDHMTESIFASIDDPDSTVSFLIGSKKFIEGWSSWRVSVMGLLKVGKSAGPQVIQLFGRGVRLKGKEMQLRRSGYLEGTHPELLDLLETLHIFGLKADYMETFSKVIRREGVPPPIIRTLKVEPRIPDGPALLAPDPGEYVFQRSDVVVFDPSTLGNPVELDLMPTFTVAAGVEEHHQSSGGLLPSTGALPTELVDGETLYLELLDFKRRRGWFNTYITRSAVKDFLRDKVQLTAPKELFGADDYRSRELLNAAAQDALHKGLERFVYKEQRTRETRHLGTASVTDRHANFPRIKTEDGESVGYRLEIPEDLVKEVDKLIADIEAGKATREDMAEPLPRLHLDAHLYNPLLVRESDVGERGQQLGLFHEVAIRSTPSGLVESEVRFIRDLRDWWEAKHEEGDWPDHEIHLLRNLPRRGVGFFKTAGFYPDFMLWLRKGADQALAFIEPHGMVIWDPVKVALLEDIRKLGLENLPVLAYIVTQTPPKSIGAIGGGPVTENYLRDHHILQQDGSYIDLILTDLKVALESVAAGQYEADAVSRFRLVDATIRADGEIGEQVRHVEYLPIYNLQAAAGAFGAGEAVELDGWVRVNGPLREGLFVARAVGKSMTPLINDGDLCLFSANPSGGRQGKIVLVQWAGPEDPETGGSYAVKRYHRIGERGSDDLTIELRSENPEYEPIVLTPEYEPEVAVAAEFLQVLRPPADEATR